MAELKDYSAASLLEKERASNQVELDTDDVKEESISVEEISNKDESPNLNLGEIKKPLT